MAWQLQSSYCYAEWKAHGCTQRPNSGVCGDQETESPFCSCCTGLDLWTGSGLGQMASSPFIHLPSHLKQDLLAGFGLVNPQEATSSVVNRLHVSITQEALKIR